MPEVHELQNNEELAKAVAKMPANRPIEGVERSGREVWVLASIVLVAFSKVKEPLCTIVQHLLHPQTNFSFTLYSSKKR